MVGPDAAATKSSSAHIKSLEAKYGTTIKVRAQTIISQLPQIFLARVCS